MMRDCRINRIFEGTNEILHLFIALTAMSDAIAQLKELASTVGNIGQVFADPIKGFGVFAGYARKQFASSTGVGRAVMNKPHPALRTHAVLLENHVRKLTGAVDRILRKHGKNIIGKQFATERLAAIMIDMFVLACTLSRVSQSIEDKGLEAAQKEIQIMETFAFQANDRMLNTHRKIDENIDENIKDIAVYICDNEKYVWDNL
jgi:hypothetical protein